MSKRLSGLNPLAYIGVEPVQPSNMFMRSVAPTPTDSRNVNIGDFWVDTTTQQLWVLVSLAGGSATWITLFGGASDVFVTDAGTATPAAGIINVLGDGLNILTSGAGNTITIRENPDPTFGNVTITGTLDITSFTGGVLVSNNSGVISEVTTTNHSLLVGNAAGTISSLGVATNGQLPIGSTGADPVLATITAGSGISVTNGAGSISIAASGAIPLTFDADSGSAAPAAGIITFHGGTGITTSAAGSTVTITSTGAGLTFDGNTGSATESGGIINIVGTGGLSTTASGNTVTISGADVAQSVIITLTSAQVKALQSTPILMLAAQGANTLIFPESFIAYLAYGGSNVFVAPGGASILAYYTNTNTSGNQISSVMLAGSYTQSANNYNLTAAVGNGGTPTTSCVNQGIYVAIDQGAAGNITGNAANDNTIKIEMVYRVITVPL